MEGTFTFMNNIWVADLANMQLLSKFNKWICFLLRYIDAFNKYIWVVPLKDKNITINTDASQKNLSESGRKSNKT